jgi:hypothetical protein
MMEDQLALIIANTPRALLMHGMMWLSLLKMDGYVYQIQLLELE